MVKNFEDFLIDWQHESDLTLKCLEALTDESLQQRVSEDGRTLGMIAWHIVISIDEMIGRTGLQFSATPHEAAQPLTIKEMVEAYRESSDSIVKAMKGQWTNESLLEEKDMYGELWTVATVLQTLIYHQIHHRGQMTILMRQAGLPVPGMYGPSKDEWLAFGEEAPE
ncbi:DinB family protein [Psychrobacillus antarcticus]|uniref:DinB family protein n=1 Tax=Psychrobacillus antarcticus TaxID=2879115 RepID=UPI002407DFA5|nr:DinB family protein [Psychrobacillus antarcticus]